MEILNEELLAKHRRSLIQAGLGELALEAGFLPKKCYEFLASFITEDKKMKEMKQYVAYLSDLSDPVYIHGESGTGKEIIARAIHGDRTGNFIAVNCSAINTELFESELFGHVSGAFTGAAGDRAGLMEAAQNGTLFLDEIGDMSLTLQGKLLRAIQEKSIRRVGDNKFRSVNCRIVAATHCDLFDMVKEKTFREDLFWRIGVYVVKISPLRDRPHDIAEIIDEKFPSHSLTNEELSSIYSLPLKGNVRELEYHVKRLILYKKLSLTLYEL